MRFTTANFVLRTALCLGGLVGTPACERGSSPEVPAARPNVIVITVDTLRADRLGCYGFAEARTPRIDKLASEGVRAEHAVAPVPLTLPSHTTIFTGLQPPAHGVRNNGTFEVPDEAVTLAERLKTAGYRTQAFISAMVLHRRYKLDQGFDGYDDHLWTGDQADIFIVRSRPGERTMDAALQWVDDNVGATSKPPFFLWLHLFDPHAPYDPPPADAALAATPYDGEIASVDRQIGRFVDALKRKNVLDDTILVFTSDHGESLGEHGEATHAVFIYEATQHVPFIVRYPPKLPRGKVYTGPVQLVDMMPTVLGLLGMELGRTQGVDLSAPFAGTKPPPTFPQYSESLHPELEYGMAPLFGIRVDDWTYIRAPRPELYDRSQDPGETRNLLEPSAVGSGSASATAAGAEALKLDHALSETLGELERLALVPEAQAVDEETAEMLRALGYVADSDATQGLQGMDPKDGMKIYDQARGIRELFRADDYAACARRAASLLKIVPNNVSALNTAALCETKLGNNEGAKGYFMRSLEADPHQASPLTQLGRLYLAEGQVERARASFEKALDVFPSSVEAMNLLGYLELVQGNADAARGWFDRAITEDPTYAQSYIGHADVYASEQRYREAKESYAKAAELQPDSFHAWFNGGLCALRLGEVQTADRNLVRATEVDPNALLRNPNLPSLQADPRLIGFRAALARLIR